MTERSEQRVVRQAFGPDARLVEHGPTRQAPGQVEIHVGSGMIGSGRTFARALADSLAFVSGGELVRASSIVGRGEQC
jgi:hypothetical protein